MDEEPGEGSHRRNSLISRSHFDEVGETESKMSKIWVVLVMCVTEKKESTGG